MDALHRTPLVVALAEGRWTALHLAIQFGYLDIALLLSEHGDDVNTKK